MYLIWVCCVFFFTDFFFFGGVTILLWQWRSYRKNYHIFCFDNFVFTRMKTRFCVQILLHKKFSVNTIFSVLYKAVLKMSYPVHKMPSSTVYPDTWLWEYKYFCINTCITKNTKKKMCCLCNRQYRVCT